MSDTTTSVRALDHGTPPERFAAAGTAWAWPTPFRDGKPHGVEAFGSKIVVWAGQQGRDQRPRRLLPPHGRRPDPGRGQGATRSPAPSTTGAGAATASARRSRTRGGCRCGPAPRRYPTAIVNDQLLVWHDAEGSERRPTTSCRSSCRASPRAPTPTGCGTPSTIEGSNCRELIDNVVDMAHFYYVHFAFPTSFRNVFEGHIATQFMESKGRPDKTRRVRRRRALPQVRGDLLRAVVHDQLARHRLQGLQDRGRAGQLPRARPGRRLLPACSTASRSRSPRASTTRPADFIAKKYAEMFGSGFLQDVHIWKNKVPVQNPLLCEEDGPVYQLRRWYEQFYVDAGRHPARDGRPVRVRGRHHEGQRVLAGGGRRQPPPEGRGGRRRRVRRAAHAPRSCRAPEPWPPSSPPVRTRSRTSGSTRPPGWSRSRCLDCLAAGEA